MKRYGHVAEAVFGRPWFIEEQAGQTIAEIVTLRLEGVELSEEDIQARLAAATAANGPRRGQRSVGQVGIIPVYGPIMHRASLMTAMSGGSSSEQIAGDLRAFLADEQIAAVLLEFDSPGGEVSGTEELATEIRAARGQKPIVAIAHTMMASAAYYLAAQADEIVASPSSLVGSIGVIFPHTERSQMNEKLGITTTLIRQPPTKAAANSHEPLTDEARAELQAIVDDAYGQFVAAVAKGRGVSARTVREQYGKGAVLSASRALEAGLVDRVDTLDGTIARIQSGAVQATRPRAGVTIENSQTTEEALGIVTEITTTTVETVTITEELDPPDRSREAEAALEVARAKAAARR